MVNALADSDVRQKAYGFVFLGTPHKGARIALAGRIKSLFGFWRGSSTSLLEITEPGSAINESLHNQFMKYLESEGPKLSNTVCVFEAVKQEIFRMPIINVSVIVPSSWGDTNTSNLQVVDKDSAIIGGSCKIGLETDHRNMQRLPNQEHEYYQNLLTWIKGWAKTAKEEADGKSR